MTGGINPHMDYQEFQKEMTVLSSDLYVDPTKKMCLTMLGVDYAIGDFQKIVHDIYTKHDGSYTTYHTELQVRLGEILIWIEYFSRVMNLDWGKVVKTGKNFRKDFHPTFSKHEEDRLLLLSLSFTNTFAILARFYSEAEYKLMDESEAYKPQSTSLGAILGVWIETCRLIKIEPENIMDFIVKQKRERP